MALETLKGVANIGGFKVLEIEKRISPDEYKVALKQEKFICVNHEANSVSFTLQKNPVKEGGVNGCQVSCLIEATMKIIEGLNKPPFNCNDNEKALGHLKEALKWLEHRTMNREKQGVEGTSKP